MMIGAGLAATALGRAPIAFAKPAYSVRLSDAFTYLDKFLALPPQRRDKFTVAYYATRDRRPAPDLRLSIVDPGGRRTALTLDRDGRVNALPTIGQLQSGARLEAESAIGGKIDLDLEMHPVTPPSTHPDPGALSAALAQANDVVRAIAGIISFVAPQISAAVFVGAGSGQAILADGHALPLPVSAGRYLTGSPYFEPKAMAVVKALSLARTPTRIVLVPHPGP